MSYDILLLKADRRDAAEWRGGWNISSDWDLSSDHFSFSLPSSSLLHALTFRRPFGKASLINCLQNVLYVFRRVEFNQSIIESIRNPSIHPWVLGPIELNHSILHTYSAGRGQSETPCSALELPCPPFSVYKDSRPSLVMCCVKVCVSACVCVCVCVWRLAGTLGPQIHLVWRRASRLLTWPWAACGVFWRRVSVNLNVLTLCLSPQLHRFSLHVARGGLD